VGKMPAALDPPGSKTGPQYRRFTFTFWTSTAVALLRHAFESQAKLPSNNQSLRSLLQQAQRPERQSARLQQQGSKTEAQVPRPKRTQRPKSFSIIPST
jgi:hypothetical protein